MERVVPTGLEDAASTSEMVSSWEIQDMRWDGIGETRRMVVVVVVELHASACRLADDFVAKDSVVRRLNLCYHRQTSRGRCSLAAVEVAVVAALAWWDAVVEPCTSPLAVGERAVVVRESCQPSLDSV